MLECDRSHPTLSEKEYIGEATMEALFLGVTWMIDNIYHEI